MFICWLSPNKKKKKKLHSNRVYQTWVLCKFFLFFFKFYKRYSSIVLHGTWVYQARVPHNFFFFNCTNSNSIMPGWQNWWGTRVSKTRVLEKVVLCHLFPKLCFFAKNLQKMCYLAILAKKIRGTVEWPLIIIVYAPLAVTCFSIYLDESMIWKDSNGGYL